MRSDTYLTKIDATLDMVISDTPNGSIVVELKIICPPGHPTGVTTAMLRSITASDLQRQQSETDLDQLALYIGELRPPQWAKGSRNSLSAKDLTQLASLYEYALQVGAHPTKTIQEWLGSSRPTASRAIKQARDLGLLGQPSKKGLPGNNKPS
jgi:CRP-like cAMP-binding protein